MSCKGILAIALGLLLPFAGNASAKTDYVFPQKKTLVGISPSGGIVVFAVCEDGVYTLRGHKLNKADGNILNVAFNPMGTNFVIVTEGDKRNDAKVMSSSVYNDARHKFNVKKVGNPTAATYTSDARNMLLATDLGSIVTDTRRFMPVDTLPKPFPVRKLRVSDNNYYVVMTGDNNVAVYNFEEKNLRKKWKFDDKVSDARFSNDNSELAILTADGILSIYDTRSFLIKKNIEGLGEGLAFCYNPDGKYIAVATSPGMIAIVNKLDDTDREYIEVPEGGMNAVEFILDSNKSHLLAYDTPMSVKVKRMTSLLPNYNKLIMDGADEKMNEWLKMMPGETMEQYSARVNDKSRARQRRLFEDEIATGLAGDLVSMATMSLGKYDRANQMLAVEFDNMPSIMLPVPENSVGAFQNLNNIEVTDAKYGVMPNDNFELIYAKFHNKVNGETFVYDNIDRVPLNFVESDDNMVSLEILQQQQMEEIKLQELKKKVVEEARQLNVISDHTNITVDSRIENAYDANGEKILNYKVKFSYEVEPGFSAQEDFGPGKYHIDESGAAKSMLALVQQALQGDFKQYLAAGKKLQVKISGAADATPIRSKIVYDGVYGDFEDEPVRKDGQITGITINAKTPVQTNEQLAFLRAYGVKDYLEKNVEELGAMKRDYTYDIAVAEGKGSEFRRIVAEFTFVDAF